MRRLYIPLPDKNARRQIVINLLSKDQTHTLSEDDLDQICDMTKGYSGSDMDYLCKVGQWQLRGGWYGRLELHPSAFEALMGDNARGCSLRKG